jgi:hypothetical protein
LHIDPAVGHACLRAASGGGFGGTASGYAAGAGGAASGTSAAGPSAGTRPHPGLVFVKQKDTFVPRIVMLGVGNYDNTEVLSGLQPGEQVALISAALLQQSRQETIDRIRSRTSLPGMGGGSTPSGGARGAGGAGGAGGGGGRPGGGPGGA